MQTTLCKCRRAPLRIAGVNNGDMAGFSVASAGDVNGVTASGAPINDLLIGAPGFNNKAGAAYLVYGGTTLTTGAKAGVVSLSQLQIMPIHDGNHSDPDAASRCGLRRSRHRPGRLHGQ